MLTHGEPNLLSVHGLRRLNFHPPHFAPVIFDLRTGGGDKAISDWIWTNLSGRFFLGDHVYVEGNKTSMSKIAAFEIAGESTYFAMFLDVLNQPR